MNIYLQLAWEYLINILETGLFYYYIRTLFVTKKITYMGFKHALAISLRFFLISICDTCIPLPIYGIIICGTYNIVFTLLLFNDTKIKCIFWSGLHGILCIISEFIVVIFFDIFANITSSQIYFGESYRFAASTLYIIILAALCYYIPLLPHKKPLFKTSQKLFITFCIVLGIIIAHCFMIIMPELEQTHSEILDVIILANIVFLCFFVSLLVYIYQLAIQQQENKALQEHTKLLELETQQYNNLLETTESLRTIKHDVHHHLATIHSFVQNNDQAKLIQYINEYEKHFNLDYSIVATGNIVIDSILSAKMFLAKQQDIKLDFSVILPDNLPFSDVALSALLGNLFDNALEACKRLSCEKERWIHFQMKALENMLIIHIENSFDGIVEKDKNDTYLSRKKEPTHGIGLKRVQTLIEEVGGFTEIRHNDSVFTVHIMVPMENKHEL